MNILEVEGKTVDDAIKKGLKKLGIEDKSLVEIEVTDQGKSGIFGIGVSKPAKVQISYNELETDITYRVKDVLTTILEKMEIDGEVADISEKDNKIYVELVSSKNSGLIIGRKGKTLESLQFIVNLMVNNNSDHGKKIILDIESYREKRERAIRKLSKDSAYKVVKSGRSLTLEPMNPFERRLIHLTLQEDDRVTTKSEGQGIYRKVIVYPNINGNSADAQ